MYTKNIEWAKRNEEILLEDQYEKTCVEKEKKNVIPLYGILSSLIIVILYIVGNFYLNNIHEFYQNMFSLSGNLLAIIIAFLSIYWHEKLHCMGLGWNTSYLISFARSYGNKPVNKNRFLFILLFPTILNLPIFILFIYVSMMQYALITSMIWVLALILNLVGAIGDIDTFIFIVKTYPNKDILIHTCVDSGYVWVKENMHEKTTNTLVYGLEYKK